MSETSKEPDGSLLTKINNIGENEDLIRQPNYPQWLTNNTTLALENPAWRDKNLTALAENFTWPADMLFGEAQVNTFACLWNKKKPFMFIFTELYRRTRFFDLNTLSKAFQIIILIHPQKQLYETHETSCPC